MSSKTNIANLTLFHLGSSQLITDVDTENSLEASSFRAIYDQQRDYVLRDFPWPFARAYADLALVSDPTETVNNDWTYAYRYPAGCLEVRRIVTVKGRSDTQPPPYTIGRDDQGRLIYTDEQDATIEYTVQILDPEEFDSIFVEALSWKIGAILAPVLPRLADKATTANQMYAFEISKAASRALNEEQAEEPREAEWISGR